MGVWHMAEMICSRTFVVHVCSHNAKGAVRRYVELNFSKRGLCSFFALLCALLLSVVTVNADQILGPLPSVVYVPVNVTAMFTCSYTDFRPNTDVWYWRVNDEEIGELNDPEIVIGGDSMSTLYATVSQHSQEPVLVMCQLFRRIGKEFLFFANSTNVSQILTYGTSQ